MLFAKHSAITGDELRELAPFDLEIGKFKEPVAASGREPQIEVGMGKLAETMEDWKRVPLDTPGD